MCTPHYMPNRTELPTNTLTQPTQTHTKWAHNANTRHNFCYCFSYASSKNSDADVGDVDNLSILIHPKPGPQHCAMMRTSEKKWIASEKKSVCRKSKLKRKNDIKTTENSRKMERKRRKAKWARGVGNISVYVVCKKWKGKGTKQGMQAKSKRAQKHRK